MTFLFKAAKLVDELAWLVFNHVDRIGRFEHAEVAVPHHIVGVNALHRGINEGRVIFCLNNIGHPYIGMLFLLFCGLCDAFDGKVARTKKNRTERMKKFGIQIDSLSDLVAFGVLPACIGIAMMRSSIYYETLPSTIFFLKTPARPWASGPSALNL